MVKRTSRILGVAFLLQAISSLAGGIVWGQGLIVPGNIDQTLVNIAHNPWQIRVYIFSEMVTAIGVIFLGAVLFVILRKQNEKMALLALGCYILEGALLAASKLATFSLLSISQEYVTVGHSAYLQTLGNLAVDVTNCGMTLLMLAFSIGAIIFYYLLDRSRIVPRWLSLWGFLTVFLCLIGTLSSMFGYKLPFFVYLPYMPFEFVIGIWILIKGISEDHA
ncbi:MAG: DUF4386 domain-containing protein [Anaerolineae bacterium]|nr:DUF4386 domain-containing protein [Anaerolineae bacterium]